MREKLTELLASVPEGSQKSIENWKCLNITINHFDAIWGRVTPEQPAFDYHSCKFSEGITKEGKWTGMKSVVSGKEHGVQMMVRNGGKIYLATFRNGKRQGLRVKADENYLVVSICKDDKAIFSMFFDKHRKEHKREDKLNEFGDLKPENFLTSLEAPIKVISKVTSFAEQNKI